MKQSSFIDKPLTANNLVHATVHVVSGLDRQVLDAACLGFVLEEPDSAAAVGAVYRRLDHQGLLDVEWWGKDPLPLEVTLTPLGRTVLRVVGRREH